MRCDEHGGSMKRRTFLKGAAVAGAAAGIGFDMSRDVNASPSIRRAG
jgi:hypothetical protein